MRETGPVRKRFDGDIEAAKDVTGFARTQLGLLKQQMELNNLQQLVRSFVLADGTTLTVQSIFGQDAIHIEAPTTTVAATLPESGVVLSSSLVEYSFTIPSTGDGSTTVTANNVAMTLGGLTFSIGVQSDALVVTKESDVNKVSIDAAFRATQIKRSSYAEALLRTLGGVSNDGAVNFDTGFLVDPVIYAAQSYGAYLIKVFGNFLSAFVHGIAPLPTYIEPTQYQKVWPPPRNDKYNNAFYIDGNPPQFLANTALTNSGASTITGATARSPGDVTLSAFDNLTIGTIFVQNRIFRNQSTQVLHQTASYSDVLLLQSEYNQRNYYLVDTNTGSFMSASIILAPAGGTNDAPNDGALVNTVFRYTQKRTVAGWTVVANQQLTADAISMAFIKDGATPAIAISGPPSTQVVTANNEQPGSVVPYAATTYVAADVSYVTGPKGGNSVFPTAPQGGGAFIFSFGQVKWMYPTSKMPVQLTNEWWRSQFAGSDGSMFQVLGDGRLRIVSPQGATILEILSGPPATLINADVPVHLQAMTWSQPQGAANIAAFYAATRVNVDLEIYNPTRAAVTAITPPAISGLGCVFHPRTGRIMYYKLVDPAQAFPAALAGMYYIAALAGVLVGDPVVDAKSKAQRHSELLAFYSVVYNTGLPVDYILMGSTGANPGVVF
jgi:hypothetical protein